LPLGTAPPVAYFRVCRIEVAKKKEEGAMNTITIYEAQRGLYLRNGRLQRVLAPGRYRTWALWGTVEIETIDLRTIATEATPALERVITDSGMLGTQVDIVDVADGTALLLERDGTPRRILMAGRWVIWRGIGRVVVHVADLTPLRTTIPVAYWTLAGTLVMDVLVRPYERVLVYVDGVLVDVLEGGRYGLSTWQRKVEIVRIETREQELQIAGQDLITADKATLRLNLLLKYVVVDPVAAAQTGCRGRDRRRVAREARRDRARDDGRGSRASEGVGRGDQAARDQGRRPAGRSEGSHEPRDRGGQAGGGADDHAS
jgi:hypothetical protein